MKNSDDQDTGKRERMREAANILRRLDERPDDAEALADKQAFVARGRAEREAFALAERAVFAGKTGIRTGEKGKKYGIAIMGAVVASLYLGWQPLSVAFLADIRTDVTASTIELKSGDQMVLDAASAVQDNTSEQVRTVNLLQGTGFFDVDTTGQRFVVSAGDITVEALGTEFEVSRLGDDLRVTVAEGVVEVRRGSDVIQLTAMEQATVSPDSIRERAVAPEDIALWRGDGLSLSGMTLAQAVSVVDRRLPGRVVVVGNALQETQLGGRLDMTDADIALQVLAASGGARIVRTSPFLTVLLNR